MSTKEHGQLLDHYRNMFEFFDEIHFNSSVTEGVYKQHLDVKSSEVISITHSQIGDNRIARSFESQTLKLIFIGSTTIYKGFPLLKEVLQELLHEGYKNWQLDVWGATGATGATGSSDCENINFNGFYKSDELSKIFHTDGVLVAPSVCNETFSLITLEALSYGIPAIVSSTVGAKDIVAQYDPWFIFSDKAQLKERLKTILTDRSTLQNFNQAIMQQTWQHSIEEHAQKVINLYK
ncbi:MAG: glycosyltransferase [Rikenellaceae bacterium]